MPMLQFSLERARKILCLGAHSDDIEIGCGGTLLTLGRRYPDLEILWVVFSGEGARTREARLSARRFLKTAAHKIVVKPFKGSFFPYQGEAIKSYFEKLKPFEPDVVFTHYRDDRHQDHRVLSDFAWNTFRNHTILDTRYRATTAISVYRTCSFRSKTMWRRRKRSCSVRRSRRSATSTGSPRIPSCR